MAIFLYHVIFVQVKLLHVLSFALRLLNQFSAMITCTREGLFFLWHCRPQFVKEFGKVTPLIHILCYL